jgi:hypothetical protein
VGRGGGGEQGQAHEAAQGRPTSLLQVTALPAAPGRCAGGHLAVQLGHCRRCRHAGCSHPVQVLLRGGEGLQPQQVCLPLEAGAQGPRQLRRGVAAGGQRGGAIALLGMVKREVKQQVKWHAVARQRGAAAHLGQVRRRLAEVRRAQLQHLQRHRAAGFERAAHPLQASATAREHAGPGRRGERRARAHTQPAAEWRISSTRHSATAASSTSSWFWYSLRWRRAGRQGGGAASCLAGCTCGAQDRPARERAKRRCAPEAAAAAAAAQIAAAGAFPAAGAVPAAGAAAPAACPPGRGHAGVCGAKALRAALHRLHHLLSGLAAAHQLRLRDHLQAGAQGGIVRGARGRGL